MEREYAAKLDQQQRQQKEERWLFDIPVLVQSGTCMFA
jgi:hypothetical protein